MELSIFGQDNGHDLSCCHDWKMFIKVDLALCCAVKSGSLVNELPQIHILLEFTQPFYDNYQMRVIKMGAGSNDTLAKNRKKQQESLSDFPVFPVDECLTWTNTLWSKIREYQPFQSCNELL